MRLDQAMVERGIAATRSQARDLIMRGCIRIDGAIARKAGQKIGSRVVIEVAEGTSPYISRGGLKLAAALREFNLSASGRTALDVGASTGGFTEVLLRAGAKRVYAVDVGRAQLHQSLREDPRVVSIEGVDARRLTAADVAEPVGAIVADVSFISLTKALPAVLALASSDAWLVALIKPQFELEPAAIGKGGIVRSPAARERAVGNVRAWMARQPGWRVVGVVSSPILGASGNKEFLMVARREP
ncbi:MAG TPA: TlyA family RNA methyltransferase [Hyphomicrobiaceae bacterium]|nr:TlyA family RNA methyltransferase [Hyphomicrobiaceae bacterium]